MPLFKVFKSESAHNDSYYEWSLPRQDKNGQWIPGAWINRPASIVLCENPADDWGNAAECYEVEYEEYNASAEIGGGLRKQMRLLRKVSFDELVHYGIFSQGTHRIDGHDAIACRKAFLKVSGTGTFHTYDKSKLNVYGSKPTVRAYGKSRIYEYGCPRTHLQDEARRTGSLSPTNWLGGLISGNFGLAPLAVQTLLAILLYLCVRVMELPVLNALCCYMGLLLLHVGWQICTFSCLPESIIETFWGTFILTLVLSVMLSVFFLIPNALVFYLAQSIAGSESFHAIAGITSCMAGLVLDVACACLAKARIARFDER